MNRRLDTDAAVEALTRGEVVALATDTVYGLAASLEHRGAIEAIFSLKRRPATLALPVLVQGVEQIERLGVTWSARATALASAFWPGPLTIVVAVPTTLARRLGAADGTVGFRRPDSGPLAQLLARTGPLAVTSANVHAQPACTSAAQVLEVFAERPDLAGVLDGGACDRSASTVVDVASREWRLLREGAIDRAALASVLGETTPV